MQHCPRGNKSPFLSDATSLPWERPRTGNWAMSPIVPGPDASPLAPAAGKAEPHVEKPRWNKPIWAMVRKNFNLSNPGVFTDAGTWNLEGQVWPQPTQYQLDFTLFFQKAMNEETIWKATYKLISEIVIPTCLLYVTCHGAPGISPAMSGVPPQFQRGPGVLQLFTGICQGWEGSGSPWVASPHGRPAAPTIASPGCRAIWSLGSFKP